MGSNAHDEMFFKPVSQGNFRKARAGEHRGIHYLAQQISIAFDEVLELARLDSRHETRPVTQAYKSKTVEARGRTTISG